MWTSIESYAKLDEMFVWGDKLLFKSLFLKDNTTLNASVTFFLFSYGGLLHYIVSF